MCSDLTEETAKKLNVAAIDISGQGGTSWSLVESHRNSGDFQGIGRVFSTWGIPTSDCIREIAKIDTPIIASGGIRNGIDAVKSLALGADCVGIALPLLREWSKGGRNGVRKFLDRFFYELKTSMFLTGSKNIKELKGKIRE